MIKQRNAHHQVTPDSVTVLVKSHADIGHSEPVTNLGSRQDGRGLLGLFFAIFAMTNMGGRQDGTGLLPVFFAIFAVTNIGDRQDGKAWGLLLFMVASFSLCTVRTKSPRELYKSGNKRVQRIGSEYSEGKNKVNFGGINWLAMESHVDFGQVEGKAIFDYPWPRDSGFEKQYFNFLLFECSKTRFSANLFFFLASGSDKVDQYIHIFSRTGTKRGFQQISWNMNLLSSDLLWDMVVFCTLWFFHKKGRSNFPNHSFQLCPNKVV